MDYEQILKKAGDTGIYQVFVVATLVLCTMYYGAETFSSNVSAPHHEHWCKVEALQNLTTEEQKYISIPYENGDEFSSCEVYDLSWDNFTYTDFLNWNRTYHENSKTKECSEYTFDTSVFKSTVASEVSFL